MIRRGRVAAAVLGAGLVVAAGCATAARPEPGGERDGVAAGEVVAPLPVDESAVEEQPAGPLKRAVDGAAVAGAAAVEEEGAARAEPAAPGSTARPAAAAAPAAAPPRGPAAAELADAPEPTSASSSSRGSAAATATGSADAASADPPPTATAPPPPASGRRRERPSEPVRQELIVVDEGSSAARPSPGELARTTRREAAGRGSAPRITNDNLSDYARRGQVTMSGTPVAEKPAAAPAADGAAGGDAADAAEPLRDEAWWRARARELREEWRQTVDEIAELEAAAADLRWRFYAEDDPWVRDGEVKPEWDRALDRLSEARRRLEQYPRRLDELVEEGRREGALPGWLREGVELEPAPEELPGAAADPAEPVEPREVDERGQGGGR